MFLDPVDNDEEHQTGLDETVGFDVGVLIREVRNLPSNVVLAHSYPEILELTATFKLVPHAQHDVQSVSCRICGNAAKTSLA